MNNKSKKPFTITPLSDMWTKHGIHAPIPPDESPEQKLRRFMGSVSAAVMHVATADKERIQKFGDVKTRIGSITTSALTFDTPAGLEKVAGARREETLEPVLLSSRVCLAPPEGYTDGHVIDVLFGQVLTGSAMARTRQQNYLVWRDATAKADYVASCFESVERAVAETDLCRLLPGFQGYIDAARHYASDEGEIDRILDGANGVGPYAYSECKTREDAARYYSRLLSLHLEERSARPQLDASREGAWLSQAMRWLAAKASPSGRLQVVIDLLQAAHDDFTPPPPPPAEPEPEPEEDASEDPQPEQDPQQGEETDQDDDQDDSETEEGEESESEQDSAEDGTGDAEEGESEEDTDPEGENASEGQGEGKEGDSEEEGESGEPTGEGDKQGGEGSETGEPSEEGEESEEGDAEGEGAEDDLEQDIAGQIEEEIKDLDVSGTLEAAAMPEGLQPGSVPVPEAAALANMGYNSVNFDTAEKIAAMMRRLEAEAEGTRGEMGASPKPGAGRIVLAGQMGERLKNQVHGGYNLTFEQVWKKRIQRTKRESDKLRGKLRFAADTQHSDEYGYRSGDLDEGNLCRVAVPAMTQPGDAPRIFARREAISRPGVAVGILIDNSGSMHGRAGLSTRIDKVKDLACLILEALHGIQGVDTAVYGYTNQTSIGEMLGAKAYGGGTEITEHVSLDAPYEMGRTTIELLNGECSTPTADAIRETARRMQSLYPQEKYAKRLLFVLSDGQPGICNSVGPWAIETAQESAKGNFVNPAQLEVRYWANVARTRFKTEVIGIGICGSYGQAASDTMYGEGKGVVLPGIEGASSVIAACITKTLKSVK
jgi:nitric oxide reductase activation protein